LEPIPSIP